MARHRDPSVGRGRTRGRRERRPHSRRAADIGHPAGRPRPRAGRQRASSRWPDSIRRVSTRHGYSAAGDRRRRADGGRQGRRGRAVPPRDRCARDRSRNVEDMARRQPLVFIGGAFVLGFVAAGSSRRPAASPGRQAELRQRSRHRSGVARSEHRYEAAETRARRQRRGVLTCRPREENRGIGDLLGDLGRQVSTLVRARSISRASRSPRASAGWAAARR